MDSKMLKAFVKGLLNIERIKLLFVRGLKILRNDGIAGIKKKTMEFIDRGYTIFSSNGPMCYTEWIRLFDGFGRSSTGSPEQRLARLRFLPRFSVVVYGKFNLHLTLASLDQQYYHHWDRIDAGRPLPNGSQLVVLRSGTVLVDDALLTMAEAMERNPRSYIFYTDHDYLGQDLVRADPYFKPSWNRDLFDGCNYLSGLWVCRDCALGNAYEVVAPHDSASEWHLLFDLIDAFGEFSVHHVPHVLAHKTGKPGLPTEEEYSMLTKRFGGLYKIKKLNVGFHIERPVPEPAPLVSLIIPTHNGLNLLRKCVDSIRGKTKYPNYEIIIVDNRSDDSETLEYFKSLEQNQIRLVRYDAPFNYSAINNHAVRQAEGEIIGLINNDIEVITDSWLREMVSHALRPEIGAVGAKLFYPDGRLQHAGVILGLGGLAGHAYLKEPGNHNGMGGRCHLVQNLSAVTAACLIVRKSVYEEVGGMNEKDFTVAFNDVDFCLKVREAGYRNLWTPFAKLIHHESATRGREDTPDKIERFRLEVQHMNLKWAEALFTDPAYNPNLTLVRENFSPDKPRHENY